MRQFIYLTISIINLFFTVNIALAQDGPPPGAVDISKIPNASPQQEALSLLGNAPHYVVRGQEYQLIPVNEGHTERGVASWYGKKFHQRETSSGEVYDMYAMTAAHKTLPIPSYIKVTNIDNGQAIVVRVNDRGPFHDDRILDLSYVAAKKLDIISDGTGMVEIEVLTLPVDQTILYVQTGAFAQQANAHNQKQHIETLIQHPVNILPVEVNNRMIYQVKIGPIASGTHLADLHSSLQQAGINDILTIRTTN